MEPVDVPTDFKKIVAGDAETETRVSRIKLVSENVLLDEEDGGSQCLYVVMGGSDMRNIKMMMLALQRLQTGSTVMVNSDAVTKLTKAPKSLEYVAEILEYKQSGDATAKVFVTRFGTLKFMAGLETYLETPGIFNRVWFRAPILSTAKKLDAHDTNALRFIATAFAMDGDSVELK